MTSVDAARIGFTGTYPWSGSYVSFSEDTWAELRVYHMVKGTVSVRYPGRFYVNRRGVLMDFGVPRNNMKKTPTPQGVYMMYIVDNVENTIPMQTRQTSMNPARLAMSAWYPATKPQKDQTVLKASDSVESFEWGGNIRSRRPPMGAIRPAEAVQVIDGVTDRKCRNCRELKRYTTAFFPLTKGNALRLGNTCLECNAAKKKTLAKDAESIIQPLGELEPRDKFMHPDPSYELALNLVVINGEVFAPVPSHLPQREGARFVEENSHFINFDGSKVFSRNRNRMSIKPNRRTVSFLRSKHDETINAAQTGNRIVVETNRALLYSWYPKTTSLSNTTVARRTTPDPRGASDFTWSAGAFYNKRKKTVFTSPPLEAVPITVTDHPIYGAATGEYVEYGGRQWAVVNRVVIRGRTVDICDGRYAVDPSGMEVLILKTFNANARKGTIRRASQINGRCLITLSVPQHGQRMMSAQSVALCAWFPDSIPAEISVGVGSPSVWDMTWRTRAEVLSERAGRICRSRGQFKCAGDGGAAQDVYRTDDLHRYQKNQRRRVYRCIDQCGRDEVFEELLGCDWDFFRAHIESQWKPGMTWDNRRTHGPGIGDTSVWRIVYVKALKDCTTKEEVDEALKFTNTRPMWVTANKANRKRTLEDYGGTARDSKQHKHARK